MSTDSESLRATPYSFRSRHEAEPGTNPEELLAAAEATCFVMSLARALRKEGFAADRLDADASISLVHDGDGYRISKTAMSLRAEVPGMSRAHLEEVAEREARACPVSRALRGTGEVTLHIES